MGSKDIDHLLNSWNFDPDGSVRQIKGSDGRNLIQVRVDLGILQLETSGRPDGSKPGGFPTLLEFLVHREMQSEEFELDDETCDEIDREFVQFYHRRIAWLRMQKFNEAVRDADHTLALMDFCREHSPDEDWTFQHEQHRSFVLFHRIQACALVNMENQQPDKAVETIDQGLEEIRACFDELEWGEFFESDELVMRLRELRDSLVQETATPKSLQQQLVEAIEAEQYELAAILRDKLAAQ